MFTVAPHATRRFRDFRSSPHGGLCGAQCWRHLENTIFNPFDSSMTECGNGFFGVDLPLKPPSVALGAVVLTLKSRAQGEALHLQWGGSPLQRSKILEILFGRTVYDGCVSPTDLHIADVTQHISRRIAHWPPLQWTLNALGGLVITL